MKKIAILAALLLTAALPALAQGTVTDPEFDFRTRTSVALDFKIVKGLHLSGEYQLRTEDMLSSIGSHRASAGLNYKFPFGLKAGVEYTFIYNNRADKGWSPRHRVTGSLGYTFKAGDWRFGIKESLRWTHKTEEMNLYQENPDPILLKSRFKVSYKVSKRVEPYGFVELRNVFNDPLVNATWSTTSLRYADYSFGGYGDTYINRVRGALGIELSFNKHNSLDIYLMEDYCYDKDIDVSKDLTTLKSLTWDQSLNTILGVGYKFSF